MINNALKERMEALLNSREDWTVDELKQELEKIVNEMNKKPLDNFEGFSPADMHYILYTPFHEKCPIGINTDISKDFLLQHSPLLKLAVYIMEKISAEGPMPLTSKGNLKVSFIKELYNLGIYYGYDRDSFEKRPYQSNWNFLEAVMLTCIIAGVLKKIKGILDITKKGNALLTDNGSSLFKVLFIANTIKLNWGYFDFFKNDDCGQLGFLWTLWILKKYGFTPKPASFYAQKYLTAFPIFINQQNNIHFADACFTVRFMARFCSYFGFIASDNNDNMALFLKDPEIVSTPLLNAFIK